MRSTEVPTEEPAPPPLLHHFPRPRPDPRPAGARGSAAMRRGAWGTGGLPKCKSRWAPRGYLPHGGPRTPARRGRLRRRYLRRSPPDVPPHTRSVPPFRAQVASLLKDHACLLQSASAVTNNGTCSAGIPCDNFELYEVSCPQPGAREAEGTLLQAIGGYPTRTPPHLTSPHPIGPYPTLPSPTVLCTARYPAVPQPSLPSPALLKPI